MVGFWLWSGSRSQRKSTARLNGCAGATAGIPLAPRAARYAKGRRSQAFTLFSQPCHYCGAIATNHSQHPDFNGSFRYNGIDRVDNSIGYTPENCVACCKHCNIAKRTMTVLEFRMWITQVYRHMGLG